MYIPNAISLRKLIVPICLTSLIIAIAIQASAQSNGKRTLSPTRLEGEPPRIDGVLDDLAWDLVEWEGDFIQREPLEGREPSQPTSFKILYDNNNLYIAIRAWDSSPDSIMSRLSRRDEGEGDAVGIEFDSYLNYRTAFTFIVNAAGVKTDKITSNDGGIEDYNWDPIWIAKTSIDDRGWVAELMIPLNQLRFNKLPSQTWGLQVGRYIFRKDELSLWQPVPRDASGWVHRFGLLTDIKGIEPKRQIEVAPYIVAQTEKYKADEDNPFSTGRDHRFAGGVDAKLGITNDITLDLTVYPDFGQVEADPSEVNLTAFETFFAEKRPFFVEGRDLFNFSFAMGGNPTAMENLFYSRRIGRRPQGNPDLSDGEHSSIPSNTEIIAASKVTGKGMNDLSYGLMNAVTTPERALIGTNGSRRYEQVEPLTNYLVGVVNMDYNEGNTRIKGLATSTNRSINTNELEFLHRNAFTGGVELLHRWNEKKYYVNVRGFMSHVEGSTEAIVRTQTQSSRYFQRPDASHVSVDSSLTSLTGHGGYFAIGKDGGGNWRYVAFATFKSPKLEVNDVGYLRGVDEIFQVCWVGYNYWEPFLTFRRININFNQWSGHNFEGERSYLGGNVNWGGQLNNYWYIGGGVSIEAHGISYSALRGGPSLRTSGGINPWVYLSTDGRRKIILNINASAFQGESSESQNLSLGLTYNPINALSTTLSAGVLQRNNKLHYVENIEWGGATHYLNATLDYSQHYLQLRANYTITPELTLQLYARPFIARGEYTNFKRITNPRASRFNDRFEPYSSNQLVYNADDNNYSIDYTADGQIDYSFDNPNFNVRHLQSNLVVRWEYRPGSTLFLVWTQGRHSFNEDHSVSIGRSNDELFREYPHNVFLVKLSYRFY